jgi:hypothetical protein
MLRIASGGGIDVVIYNPSPHYRIGRQRCLENNKDISVRAVRWKRYLVPGSWGVTVVPPSIRKSGQLLLYGIRPLRKQGKERLTFYIGVNVKFLIFN